MSGEAERVRRDRDGQVLAAAEARDNTPAAAPIETWPAPVRPVDEEWGDGTVANEDRRVANVAPADYAEDSALMRSLILAVEALCKRIALAWLSVGE